MNLRRVIDSLSRFSDTVCPNLIKINEDCKSEDENPDIFLDSLKLLISELQTIASGEDGGVPQSDQSSSYQDDKVLRPSSRLETREVPKIPPDAEALVQIKAQKSEIDRRIAAFIERKQADINESNRKEFCTLGIQEGSEDSCARTNAVFVARAGCKSHVKVSRVVNTCGPQTKRPSNATDTQHEMSSKMMAETALNERLGNMEAHVKCKPDLKTSDVDVYDRIKTLENRILFLESLSPEYFNTMPPPPKKIRSEPNQIKRELGKESTSQFQGLSVREIDERIRFLQTKLKTKS